MKKYTKKTIRYYDSIARDYINNGAAIVLKDRIGQFTKFLSGKKVLDVACGIGHDSNYLNKKGFNCLGVDLSEKMIEIAKERYIGKFKVMDFFDLKSYDNYFDGMWCSSIFVHIKKTDVPKILSISHKILKNDGVIGIITAKKRERKRKEGDTREYVMFENEELEKYLKNAGFEILVSEVFQFGGNNRLFIIARKKSERPLSVLNLSNRNVRIAVSPICNFHCIYCDEHKVRKTNKPGAMEDFRRSPLVQGVIDTDEYIKIIRALHLAGFEGLTLTGGEPFLNPKWSIIVNKAKKIGMKRIGVTTNGMLLSKYLEDNGHLPKSLTLLTLSLDTTDPKRFRHITRNGDLNTVLEGIWKAKKDNPSLTIRVNKVLMRSDKKNLLGYIDFCDKSGIINEINFLNLILKESKNRKFFKKEYISTQEILKLLSKQITHPFKMDNKYEFRTELASGLKIILKDTNLTMRNKQCSSCPIYCQEGLYTVWVATDGTINLCPDYTAQLPYAIDGLKELKKGNLHFEVKKMVKIFDEVRLEKTLNKFFRVNKINFKK